MGAGVGWLFNVLWAIDWQKGYIIYPGERKHSSRGIGQKQRVAPVYLQRNIINAR